MTYSNGTKPDDELIAGDSRIEDRRLSKSLRDAVAVFLGRMPPEEWKSRRQQLIDYLKSLPTDIGLDKAQSIRFQKDEIVWYLFLCEQTLNDSRCVDVSQQQRILPFFLGLGARLSYASSVKGLDKKIDDILSTYKSNPDGLIFEILVALSYAEKGWAVEFLEEGTTKTPDMVARKNGNELYIECKRLVRRTEYAEQERSEFLRLWEAGKETLVKNQQWVWMKGVFHSEVSSLPTNFLSDIFKSKLPISTDEILLHDDADVTIYARLIDAPAVKQHMSEYCVKLGSPFFTRLLGGNWAPMNSQVTMINAVRVDYVADCEVQALGGYIDDIEWGCGFTRSFDSEVSVDKKARDILTHLARAVDQLPKDKPSFVHIAAETFEGKDVERRRTEKVINSMESFTTDRPLLGISFHRFLANQCADKLYEFDETVDKFRVNGFYLKDIPENVVNPYDVVLREGQHWEIYP